MFIVTMTSFKTGKYKVLLATVKNSNGLRPYIDGHASLVLLPSYQLSERCVCHCTLGHDIKISGNKPSGRQEQSESS